MTSFSIVKLTIVGEHARHKVMWDTEIVEHGLEG